MTVIDSEFLVHLLIIMENHFSISVTYLMEVWSNICMDKISVYSFRVKFHMLLVQFRSLV